MPLPIKHTSPTTASRPQPLVAPTERHMWACDREGQQGRIPIDTAISERHNGGRVKVTCLRYMYIR